MIDMILRGGWVMVPIILGSVVGIAIILERFWYFRSIRLDTAEFAGELFSLVQRGQVERALGSCDRASTRSHRFCVPGSSTRARSPGRSSGSWSARGSGRSRRPRGT